VLTADLVNARRRGAELFVTQLSDESRASATALAEKLILVFRANVGQSRDELLSALAAIEVEPREQRLKDGLVKLLDDRATWDTKGEIEPEVVRRDLFLRATKNRASLRAGERFDRAALIAEVAAEQGTQPAALERALYADLRGANTLSRMEAISAPALVDVHERGQPQAVLLRAVRIKVVVRCASPASARSLFRRIKFLGLLHTISPLEAGYEITIDGPLSLFESVTKYGQKMALVLPVLEGCEAWTLEADVRWGKDRLPLTFRTSGGAAGPALDEPPMPDEIATLRRAFSELRTAWRVSPSKAVLDLPGTGLCVPDLVFTRGKHKIYFEALGFWSRDAVFRRVDLVNRGLSATILFAVSSRLRVSEEVLDGDASGALYVYKGTMSARSVAEHLERLAKGG
jgi:predicted nuclease of restriction endonuclease-like RecB superfamily